MFFFFAQNISRHSSNSEVLQLVSVNFYLVFIRIMLPAQIQSTVGCLLFHFEPYFTYTFCLVTVHFYFRISAWTYRSFYFIFACFICSFHLSSVILVL